MKKEIWLERTLASELLLGNCYGDGSLVGQIYPCGDTGDYLVKAGDGVEYRRRAKDITSLEVQMDFADVE